MRTPQRRTRWGGKDRCAHGIAMIVMLLALATAAVRADVFHLKSGGTVAGELLEQSEDGYRVRTGIGVVTLARDDVERVEQTESPFAELDRRRAAMPDEPDALVAFAVWCRENDFRADERKALLQAIALEPDHAGARAALGYVRVGDIWVDSAKPAARSDPTSQPTTQEDDRQARARQQQATWARRIAAIKYNMLESSIERVVADGRKRIVEISDPLAILPLAEKLSTGPYVARDALVDVLSKFPQDEATMNLAALALIDPDRSIRRRAVGQLARRDDPRVVAQFREALKTDDEFVIRNAADGLGVFGDPAAIPELIDALHVQRVKRIEIPTRQYFGSFTKRFSGSTRVTFGASDTLDLTPRMGVATNFTQPIVGTTPGSEVREVTVYRTEVMEALKAITGENFGFDSDEWRRWYEEERP